MRSRNFYAFLLALVFAGIQLTGCGGSSTPIAINGSLPATGTVGTAYSGSLTALGGSGSYTWTVTGLPAGVSASGLMTSTVMVAGTPTTAGTASVTATVTDTKSRSTVYAVSIVISASATPVTISGTLANTATVGTLYNGSLTAAGGSGSYTWTVTGLPAGVTASNLTSATVTIAGTPTATGTSTVSATVADTNNPTSTANYGSSIVVSNPTSPITIGGTLPDTGTVGTPYTGTITASGGTPPYQWNLTNGPSGLSAPVQNMAALTLSGTPNAAATYKFKALVTDAASNTATYSVTIVISGSTTIVITGTLPATGAVGTAYSGSITASGGTPPYQWNLTNLPAGVGAPIQNQAELDLSGTPTTAATYAFHAVVTDSATPPNTTDYSVHIVISGGAATTACSATPAARGNEAAFKLPYAFILSGFGAGGPTGFAGSVTPDGTGKISAGAIDTYANGLASQLAIDPANSTYSFGADGRGCMSLAYSVVNPGSVKVPVNNRVPSSKNHRVANTAKAQATPTGGTLVLSFALSTAYQTGRIQEFDITTSSSLAAGQMHQQTAADFDRSSLALNYVIGVDGWAADGAGGYVRAGMAASVSNVAGVTTTLSADLDIDGEASGQLTGGSGALNAVDATTGRGTGSYTANGTEGNVTFNFAYYVINGGDFYAISTDGLINAGTLAVTGRALASSTSAAPLSGYYLVATTGFDTSAATSANTATIGTFQATTPGNIVNATLYTNDAGTFTTTPYPSATYALDAGTARAAITGVSTAPPIAYLTSTTPDDGIAGFVVGTGADSSAGFLFLQTGGTPAYNAASLAGPYIFGAAEDISGEAGSQVGQYIFSAGGYTNTIDAVSPSGPNGLLPDQTASGGIAVNADGSGIVGSNLVIVTNGTVLFGVDNSATQPLLYIWVSQTVPE